MVAWAHGEKVVGNCMAESNPGKALYAVHQGTYVLKLIGEIRVPICATLDHFIHTMFADRQLNSVLIDLSETQIIDSTALGLLAKVAISAKSRFDQKPLIISTEPDVTRVLDSMGFDKVFNVVHEAPVKAPAMSEMPRKTCSEGDGCKKVLEAHRILMDLNEKNRETFKDVVAVLESQQRADTVTNETPSDRLHAKHHRLN